MHKTGPTKPVMWLVVKWRKSVAHFVRDFLDLYKYPLAIFQDGDQILCPRLASQTHDAFDKFLRSYATVSIINKIKQFVLI